MASIISAGTTSSTALNMSGDTSGTLVLQTSGTTALTISNTQNATFANVVTATGGFVVGASAAPTFSATSNATQTISVNVFTLINLQTKNWDTATAFNNTGSTVTLNGISVPAYAFAPPVAGYYQVSFSIDSGTSSTAPTRALTSIYKNGTQVKNASNFVGAAAYSGAGSGIIYLNGTSDYIQMYGLIGATTAIVTNSSAQTFFEAAMIRSA